MMANESIILWISFAEWAISVLSPEKQLFHKYVCGFCLRSEVCNCK